jgi:hypothetical protein
MVALDMAWRTSMDKNSPAMTLLVIKSSYPKHPNFLTSGNTSENLSFFQHMANIELEKLGSASCSVQGVHGIPWNR